MSSRKCGDVTDPVDQTILRPFPDWPDHPCSPKTQEIRPSDADAVSSSSRLRLGLVGCPNGVARGHHVSLPSRLKYHSCCIWVVSNSVEDSSYCTCVLQNVNIALISCSSKCRQSQFSLWYFVLHLMLVSKCRQGQLSLWSWVGRDGGMRGGMKRLIAWQGRGKGTHLCVTPLPSLGWLATIFKSSGEINPGQLWTAPNPFTIKFLTSKLEWLVNCTKSLKSSVL